MCKIIFTSIFVFIFSVVFCQPSSNDSLDFYIKDLNWQSFQLTPTYFHQLVLNEDAQSILCNPGNKFILTRKLLHEICNKEKTVVIHIILTKIFEPKNNNFSESYIYNNDSITTVNFTYNTLPWQYQANLGKYKIDEEAIKKIKNYWEKRLAVLLKPDNVQ